MCFHWPEGFRQREEDVFVQMIVVMTILVFHHNVPEPFNFSSLDVIKRLTYIADQ